MKELKLSESEARILKSFIGCQNQYEVKAIASKIFDDEIMINGFAQAIKDIYNKLCEL